MRRISSKPKLSSMQSKRNNKTFKELRNHDTDALNFIGALAMTEIKLSPEYPNWEALPYECVSRSFRFLTMVKAMFSKGNSGEAVDVTSN